jgi:hypothetical protein
MVERCMASWLDQRLRTVLDEKLREWVPKAPPPANAPSKEQPEYPFREGPALLAGYSQDHHPLESRGSAAPLRSPR